MSKARGLRKKAKGEAKRTGQPCFFEGLHEALLETLSWANGEIALRTTILTPTSRTVKFCKIGDLWKDGEA